MRAHFTKSLSGIAQYTELSLLELGTLELSTLEPSTLELSTPELISLELGTLELSTLELSLLAPASHLHRSVGLRPPGGEEVGGGRRQRGRGSIYCPQTGSDSDPSDPRTPN